MILLVDQVLRDYERYISYKNTSIRKSASQMERARKLLCTIVSLLQSLLLSRLRSAVIPHSVPGIVLRGQGVGVLRTWSRTLPRVGILTVSTWRNVLSVDDVPDVELFIRDMLYATSPLIHDYETRRRSINTGVEWLHVDPRFLVPGYPRR